MSRRPDLDEAAGYVRRRMRAAGADGNREAADAYGIVLDFLEHGGFDDEENRERAGPGGVPRPSDARQVPVDILGVPFVVTLAEAPAGTQGAVEAIRGVLASHLHIVPRPNEARSDTCPYRTVQKMPCACATSCPPEAWTLGARCTRCGGSRMLNGTCTFIGCPDPLWDNRNGLRPCAVCKGTGLSPDQGAPRTDKALPTADQAVTGCVNFIMGGLANMANGKPQPKDWIAYVSGECDALLAGAWRRDVDDPEEARRMCSANPQTSEDRRAPVLANDRARAAPPASPAAEPSQPYDPSLADRGSEESAPLGGRAEPVRGCANSEDDQNPHDGPLLCITCVKQQIEEAVDHYIDDNGHGHCHGCIQTGLGSRKCPGVPRAETARVDDKLVRFARYIAERGDPARVHDHACAECIPHGEIVIPGFRCVVHEARAVLDEKSTDDEPVRGRIR